jgi:potassium-transporting ATPase KdpC subunit
MKSSNLLSELRIAVLATIGFIVVLCVCYPLAVWGISQLVFPTQANGSLIRNSSGDVIGSILSAQAFDDSIYFHPRPSAAGTGYDAANSGGSNLGPLSQKLIAGVADRVAAYRELNGVPADVSVPADAVTASASGLDRHISMANAELQTARVAAARGLSITVVQRLVEECTDPRSLGIFGEPGVNVLKLNLVLDGLR